VSISGRRLTRTLAGNRTETEFGSDGDVLAAYKDLFGIQLQRSGCGSRGMLGLTSLTGVGEASIQFPPPTESGSTAPVGHEWR